MNETTYYTELPSPLGPLFLTSDGQALTGLYMSLPGKDPRIEPGWIAASTPFESIRAELQEYFAGRLRTFASPVHFQGTPFQVRVWQALTTIPYGVTISYVELAHGGSESQSLAHRWPGERAESRLDPGALSSRHRSQWRVDWLWRWHRAETLLVGAGRVPSECSGNCTGCVRTGNGPWETWYSASGGRSIMLATSGTDRKQPHSRETF